ncbi:signal transduction histidine kinase [Flammeovirgaceae bacterium 311]|nr:signal transduction histidine kinase [Flammeovirgaceae bacterium 311]
MGQLLGWSAMALREVINYTFFIVGKFNWDYVVFFFLHVAFGIGVSHLLHLWLRKSKVFEKSAQKIVSIGIGLVLGFACILGLFSLVLSIYMDSEASPDVPNILVYYLGLSMNWIQVTTPWILFYFLYRIMEQNNTIRNEKLQAINLVKTSELELLKSQLNPHFLFNALNSIKALISIEPEKARGALIQLSELLRFSLNYEKQTLIRLSHEMEEVEKYLELEKIRFDDRLQYELVVDKTAANAMIPPALILTLVENAIKHGISHQIWGGKVTVKARQQDAKLEVEVSNPGYYQPVAENRIGLKNVQERLAGLYGNKASFTIRNGKEHTVIARVSIEGERKSRQAGIDATALSIEML